MASATLLTKKPMSGEYLERQFSCSARKNAWVIFSGEDFKPWIGVFGTGDVSFFCGTAQFYGTNIFLIIAGGQGYIVDVKEGQLLRRTSWDYSYSCITVPKRPFVLVADNIGVWACYIDKDIDAIVGKRSVIDFDRFGAKLPPPPPEDDRIALDGIVFDTVSDAFLSGKAWWSIAWCNFRIDLNDMSTVIEKKILTSQWDAFLARPEIGGFPYSKDYSKHMSAYLLE
jgi:hypothetical protein